MAAKRIDGRDLMLFRVGEDGKSSPKAFACAETCSISVTSETESISDKDASAFDEIDLKKISYEMSTTTLIAEVGAAYDIIEAQLKGEKFAVLFALAANASKSAVEDVEGKAWTPVKDGKLDGFYGVVMVSSAQIEASNDGKAKLSITLKGAGELKRIGKADRPVATPGK